MTPDRYCQEKCARSGSSFYYSFWVLPPLRRRAIMAFYAFCREVDDVVDETENKDIAAIKLAWWKEEIARLYAGKATHLVTQALAAIQAEIPLSETHLLEIIEGMAMDLDKNRYANFEELFPYCYRAASVVGLVAAKIFGYTDPATENYATDLGMAFQLTNILRDVGEDARRGRIYLPEDEMCRFGLTEQMLLAHDSSKYPDNFQEFMKEQATRADAYYDSAFSHLPLIDRKSQRPGLMMAAIYRTLLEEIKAADFQVLHQRISLPTGRKLWLAAKTWVHG